MVLFLKLSNKTTQRYKSFLYKKQALVKIRLILCDNFVYMLYKVLKHTIIIVYKISLFYA